MKKKRFPFCQCIIIPFCHSICISSHTQNNIILLQRQMLYHVQRSFKMCSLLPTFLFRDRKKGIRFVPSDQGKYIREFFSLPFYKKKQLGCCFCMYACLVFAVLCKIFLLVFSAIDVHVYYSAFSKKRKIRALLLLKKRVNLTAAVQLPIPKGY